MGENMKFLIYGGPGIGDLAIILPMAVALKQHYRGCEVDLLISSNAKKIGINLSMLQYQNYIDHAYYYIKSEVLHDFSLLYHIRKKHYEYFFICQYHHKNSSVWPSIISRLAGCKSVGAKPDNPKIKYDYMVDIDAKRHISDYCFFLLQFLGITERVQAADIINYSLLEEKANHFKIDWNSKRYIALCIGAGMISQKVGRRTFTSNLKCWDLRNWLQLSSLLVKEDFGVILLGGPYEQTLLQQINSEIPPGVIDFVGKTDVGGSLALIYKSELAAGADTGLMHWAGMFGRKTVSLFGYTDPCQYAPYGSTTNDTVYLNLECSPCFGTEKAVACKDNICMKNITVEMVYQKIIDRMQDTNEDRI